MQIHTIIALLMEVPKTTENKSAKISLRAPSIKWKECKYISARGENMFLRRQGDYSKPPGSFVAKSQHFSWKIYSIAEQPFVLPHGCLQTKRSASDWHKLQAAARNQAGPFYSLLFCYFFSLSRAHLLAWMRTQRKADGNTICSLGDSRGCQNAD